MLLAPRYDDGQHFDAEQRPATNDSEFSMILLRLGMISHGFTMVPRVETGFGTVWS